MKNIKINDWIKILIIGIMLSLIVLSAFSSLNSLSAENINPSTYFFLAFSIILLAQLIFLIGNEKLKYYFIALVALELILNVYNNLEKNTFNNKASDLAKTVNKYSEPIKYVKSIDNSFYRMEFIELNTTNDGMLFDYHGINFFNSTRNQKAIDFLEFKLGVDVDSGCGVKLKSYNPALLSLLNIKYLIGDIDYYETIFDNNDKPVHHNNYPLALGFMVNKKSLKTTLVDGGLNSNIDAIYNSFLNENNTFIKHVNYKSYIDGFNNSRATKHPSSSSYELINNDLNGSVSLNYKSDGEYLLFPDEVFKKAKAILINNKVYRKNKGNFIYLKEGDIINVTIQIAVDSTISDNDFYFYLFDLNKYNKVAEKLNANLWNLEENGNHLLSGLVTATKEKNILFTSIPYEKGFKIKVDNKEVSPEIIFDTFIGLKLEPGEHTITFDYIPQGLYLGSVISFSTLLIVSGYYIIKSKKVSK